MRRVLGACTAILAFLSTAPILAEEETVVLKNGDRLTGEVLSSATNEVVLVSPIYGKIVIPLSQVSKRETNSPPPSAVAPSAPPAPVTAAVPATAPPKGSAVGATPTNASPNGELMAVWNQTWSFLEEWSGEMQLGANLVFSSRDRQTYTGRMKATHMRGPMRNILDYNASYGKTEGLLSENRMDGSWKIEHDLNPRFLIYNAAGAGYDEIRAIDLQYDIGPGVGYKILLGTNQVLKVESGANYQAQFYQDGSSENRYSIRVAEEYWRQFTKRLRWDEKIEFYPRVDDFGEYRIRFETNLSYSFRENLTLTVNVTDLYETDVPGGISHNDLQIRSLIGLKF